MRGIGAGAIVRQAVSCYKKLADFPYGYCGKTGTPRASREDHGRKYQGKYWHF